MFVAAFIRRAVPSTPAVGTGVAVAVELPPQAAKMMAIGNRTPARLARRRSVMVMSPEVAGQGAGAPDDAATRRMTQTPGQLGRATAFAGSPTFVTSSVMSPVGALNLVAVAATRLPSVG